MVSPTAKTASKRAPKKVTGKVIEWEPPASTSTGSQWGSALECLEEIVRDIKCGRLKNPTMCYVGMKTMTEVPGKNVPMVGYPMYFYGGNTFGQGMDTFVGIMERHKRQLMSLWDRAVEKVTLGRK